MIRAIFNEVPHKPVNIPFGEDELVFIEKKKLFNTDRMFGQSYTEIRKSRTPQ